MKKLSRLLIIALIAVSALALTACGANQKPTLDPLEAENLGMSAIQMFEQISAISDEELDEYIDEFEYQQNTVYANGFNSWKNSKAELGEYLDYENLKTVRENDGSYKTTALLKFTKRDCEYILALDKRQAKITELTFNPVYTTGEKMSQAAVNLVVGMGTVFAVLIFLTLIISLFKYVNKAEEKLQQKKSKAVITETATKAPAKAPAPAASAAADSNEIQAVIAAAIAAYESECGGFNKQPALNNGLVIRSYKRS